MIAATVDVGTDMITVLVEGQSNLPGSGAAKALGPRLRVQ